MKTWIKYTVLLIIAFIIGIGIGYLTVMINPEYRIDVAAIWNTIISVIGLYTLIAIITIIIIIIIAASIIIIRRRAQTKEFELGIKTKQ